MLTVNDIIEHTMKQVNDIKSEEKKAEAVVNTPKFSSDLAAKMHKVALDLKQRDPYTVVTSDVIAFAKRLAR